MRHMLVMLIIAAGASALSASALAQRPGACSNVQVGNAKFMRCQGQSTRDFLLPKSGGTTDPAARGKPYGGWGSRFGGQSWQR